MGSQVQFGLSDSGLGWLPRERWKYDMVCMVRRCSGVRGEEDVAEISTGWEGSVLKGMGGCEAQADCRLETVSSGPSCEV